MTTMNPLTHYLLIASGKLSKIGVIAATASVVVRESMSDDGEFLVQGKPAHEMEQTASTDVCMIAARPTSFF